MVNNSLLSDTALDSLFGALSDTNRRSILTRLASGPMTVTQIASHLPISMPATSKHLRSLESAGLLTRTAEGRIRRCTLNPVAFESAEVWIQRQRAVWDARFDALEKYLEATKPEES